MPDTTTTNRNDPDAIERDVRRTQDEIGRTVDQLEEKLTPEEMTRSVLGDDGTEVAREALEVTRANPIPVALIAIGVIWLIASSNSPAVRRMADRISGKSKDTDLRSRSEEPAPIGPPPSTGEAFDRRA